MTKCILIIIIMSLVLCNGCVGTFFLLASIHEQAEICNKRHNKERQENLKLSRPHHSL